jgi:hypothetical protein
MHPDESVDDLAVRRALRALRPSPVLTPADLDRLTARIGIAASGAPPGWRDELVRLGRVIAPLALAAGLAAFVLYRGWGAEPAAGANDAFLSALTGQETYETVLDATLGERNESWLLAERR